MKISFFELIQIANEREECPKALLESCPLFWLHSLNEKYPFTIFGGSSLKLKLY